MIENVKGELILLPARIKLHRMKSFFSASLAKFVSLDEAKRVPKIPRESSREKNQV